MRVNRPLRAGGSLSAGPSLGSIARIRAAAVQTFESLAVRDFRILWWGFMGSWMAMQMQQVARGYLAYKLTGNALSLGLVTLAMGLPRIVLSPAGGVMADRFAKRSVLLWTQLALGLIALFQAILVATNIMTINWLIVAGLFQGAAFAINMPARQAYIPQIVGRGDNLANAVSLNSAGMNFTRVVGPALAGVLIAVSFINLAGVYFLVAACYIWVWLSIYRVENTGASVMKRGGVRGSLTDGFRYIWRKPALLVLMSLGFIPLAIGMPYLSLMPVVALGSLHLGSTGLGVLLTVAGVGALVGTLAIAYLARYPNKRQLQLALGVLFGLTLVGFAYFVRQDELILALPFLFLTGMAGDAYQALNSALIMMNTDEAVYGRVMGVYMVAQSIRPITVLPISAIADAITTPLTLLFSGGFCAAFVGGLAAFYPGYRHIGDAAPVVEEAVSAVRAD
ncbi:MAG TPA: MFS transporter [Thermomicrobiaceae bacterium]|nr:MFS transporter [Thermomicrobiaceae bacterium]